MDVQLDLENLKILSKDGRSLLFEDVAEPLNPYHQGQYSTNIASLASVTVTELAYPSDKKRPDLKDLDEMQKRDPVVQQCIAFKGLRTVQNFGAYSHPVSDIEEFITSNLNTLPVNFKRTLFQMITSVILYGCCFAEFTLTSKARGFASQWRLAKINVLDPKRIQGIKGKNGRIETVSYDTGDGKIIQIPYAKCIHIINNSCSVFDDDQIWGVGDGASALNYYKLKKVVLTQLALATKNNATGIIHAKTNNAGRTVLVDSKMQPIKGANGKPMEVTKQVALNYQLQDLYKKDYIVTESDVSLDRIQVQNNERFWEYILGYIDKSLQRSFAIPVGIFDSGMSSVQNIGISQNYKSVFDSTIYAMTTLLKEELITKIIKRLLLYNFPLDWFKNNYGEFRFSQEEDPNVVNSRLSTVSSLIASGILDQNDPDIIALIKKNLGLPTLDQEDKIKRAEDKRKGSDLEDLQYQLQLLQSQMQVLQTQQQIDTIQNPPPPPPPEPNIEEDTAQDMPQQQQQQPQ